MGHAMPKFHRVYADIKAPDKPSRLRSLIRAFAGR